MRAERPSTERGRSRSRRRPGCRPTAGIGPVSTSSTVCIDWRVVRGRVAAVLAVLALLFIVVPLLEIWVIVQVGQAIGVLNTFGLLILSGVVGGSLMKREGL